MVRKSQRVKLGYSGQETECREKKEMQNLCAVSRRTEQCCRKHRRRLELFCQDDETFICVLCVPKHTSHSIVFLQEAVGMYKDKLNTALTSLDAEVKDFKYLRNKQQKEILDIQEDALSLEQYITQEFAKLHQFLKDKEQKLLLQLKNEDAPILQEMAANLECINREIIACNGPLSSCNLELKIKEEFLKKMEIKSESTEHDVVATQESSDSNLDLGEKHVGLLTMPESFEDVAVTFSEEEWKMLTKQDKVLHKKVMVQNYETMVSVGYRISPETLLLLLKANGELQKGGMEGKSTTELKKDNVTGCLYRFRNPEHSASCSQQPLLGTPQLHQRTENLLQCARPEKGYAKLHPEPVPHPLSGYKRTKTSECDTSQKAHTEMKTCNCTECCKGLMCLSSIQKHRDINTGAKPYKCTDCSKYFSHKSALVRHRLIHTGEKPHQCAQCSKSFSRLCNLRQHEAIHTGQKPYKCTECGNCFINPSNLRQHQTIHAEEKPYKCVECSKSFSRPGYLQRHYASHRKPYKCTECSKCFAQKQQLMHHQNVHTGYKPYKCTDCNKCFAHQSHLIHHRAIHTGKKPYKCAECSKNFAHKWHLKSHQYSHTGYKPHKCAECSKCFSWKRDLVRHQFTHLGIKPYKCDQCSKSFTKISSLRQHQAIHTLIIP